MWDDSDLNEQSDSGFLRVAVVGSQDWKVLASSLS